MFSLRLY